MSVDFAQFSTTHTFPRILNLSEIFEAAELESKKNIQNGRFQENGNLRLDAPLAEFDMLKNFAIKISNTSEIKTVSMLVNHKLIEKVNAEDANRELFKFTVFDVCGIIQRPKLFDIEFVCEPEPHHSKVAELTYYGFNFDDTVKSFLNYNKYYGIHRFTYKGKLHTEKILVIYYCPMEEMNYNVKFMNIADIEEFNIAVNSSYNWEVLTMRRPGKKSIKRASISTYVTKEIADQMSVDKFLSFDSSTTSDSDQLCKTFIVDTQTIDALESHLAIKYGLVAYIKLSEFNISEIDYEAMNAICKYQTDMFERVKKISIS